MKGFCKVSVNFKFIGLFTHIIRLQYMQEQSRQTLLPGRKLFYEHPPFTTVFYLIIPQTYYITSVINAGGNCCGYKS